MYAGAYHAARLRQQLQSKQVSLADLHVAESLDSTNADALLRVQAVSPDRFVVTLADTQTAGRGRRGKRWESPPGGSIYLSIGWRSNLPLDYEPGALPLAIGTAVADALASQTGLKLALKWPNDIYLDAGKLGGILLESRVNARTMSLVVGVGINLVRDASITGTVRQAVRFLDDHAPGQDRQALVVAIIAECIQAIGRFRRDGLAGFHPAWEKYDLLNNSEVRVHAATDPFNGIARGISESGELRVETADGLRLCHAGEVSVRVAE